MSRTTNIHRARVRDRRFLLLKRTLIDDGNRKGRLRVSIPLWVGELVGIDESVYAARDDEWAEFFIRPAPSNTSDDDLGITFHPYTGQDRKGAQIRFGMKLSPRLPYSEGDTVVLSVDLCDLPAGILVRDMDEWEAHKFGNTVSRSHVEALADKAE